MAFAYTYAGKVEKRMDIFRIKKSMLTEKIIKGKN